MSYVQVEKVQTPVVLYVDGERVGTAAIEADVIPKSAILGHEVVNVQMDEGVDVPEGARIEAHFPSALEGISFIAAQNPLRIGKDC